MSRDAPSVTLRRLRPGVYQASDGRHAIVRTDSHQGPRGGARRIWEIVVIDDRADWIVGEYLPERTLRAAQTRLLELSGTPAPATRPPP